MTRFQSTALRSPRSIVVLLVITLFGVGGSVSGVRAAPVAGTPPVRAAAPCDHNLGNLAAKNRRAGACAQAPQAELIWQGRIHLGDEPGIYSDAIFSGAAVELPITLQRTSAPGADKTILVLEAQDTQTFAGYPGHLITVVLHVVDPATFHAKEVVLAKARLTSSRTVVPIDLTRQKSPYFVSVQVRQDEEVPPGAQDDFLVTRLSNLSEGFQFFANYGYSVSPFSD